MTTKQVKDKTGIGLSTVLKYADLLKIKYYGEGRRKVYDWQNEDIPRLKKAMKEAKTGRPPKTDKKQPNN